MTWEETIRSIREKPDFTNLIKFSYLEEDLKLNVERFLISEEWKATLELINISKTDRLRILDIGCGNGVTSIAFALQNHYVIAVDPDPSNTVGTGAVTHLKNLYNLKNLEVITGYAETLDLELSSFDLVYCRQSMHHANDLNKFISNLSTFLKKGGRLLTVRDHVIWNEKDKTWFLNNHPLHKFYGGENAFSQDEYKFSFTQAGLKILKTIKHFDSVINYYPLTLNAVNNLKFDEANKIKQKLKKRFGFLGELSFTYWLYTILIFNPAHMLDEKRISGRMYTYLTIKE